MSQEKELDSMSNIAALPSLSHKLISEACSGGGLVELVSDSPALKGNHSNNYVKKNTMSKRERKKKRKIEQHGISITLFNAHKHKQT